MRKISKLVVLLLALSSCGSPVEKTVTGWWSIDQYAIFFKQQDITMCLAMNSLRFHSDGTCSLPELPGYCAGLPEALSEKGEWKLIHNGAKTNQLIIQSKNEVFAGTYYIRFKRDDKNKLLKMYLESDQLSLWCSKGLFDYDRNQELINELTNDVVN